MVELRDHQRQQMEEQATVSFMLDIDGMNARLHLRKFAT